MTADLLYAALHRVFWSAADGPRDIMTSDASFASQYELKEELGK